MIPLSLYIHIPWCVRKCPYCDFNSHALNGILPEQQYLSALIADLKQDLNLVFDRELISIFFGGGTPSLISPAGIEWLLTEIQRLVKFSPNIEITLEVNPGTVERHDLSDFKTAGINRISLGVQSFDDSKLKILGRIHKSSETFQVIEKIQRAEFSSFNLDLMHGLPEQSVTQAISDLQTALSFNPPHISWYQLTIEANTIFHKYPPTLPSDDITWEIQSQGEQLLAAYGFNHYEVSAFSKPQHECVHNLNYWSFGDYLGIGAGAHAKITDPRTMQIQRLWKTRLPKDYLASDKPLAGNYYIETTNIPFEYMLNRLRLRTALQLSDFVRYTGLPTTTINTILEKAVDKGFVQLNGTGVQSQLQLTDLGKRFTNDLVQMFLISEEPTYANA